MVGCGAAAGVSAQRIRLRPGATAIAGAVAPGADRGHVGPTTSPRFQLRSCLESKVWVAELGHPFCVGSGRQPAQCFLCSFLVVFPAPGLDHCAGVQDVLEPVLVEAFLAQPAVEAFDIGVLVRLAQLDQPPANEGAPKIEAAIAIVSRRRNVVITSNA